MDIRIPIDREILALHEDREGCPHSSKDLLLDTEIVRISHLKYEIYEHRKCSRGCHYRVFSRIHTISSETAKSMCG